jgi:lipopolysaccharide transport system permease protein
VILSLHPLQASRHLRWDLIIYKALSSLQSETSRSRLGFLWWILDPVMYMCVFYVVFGLIFERGGPDFVVKLLIALVIWRWFDNSVKGCASSLISGVGLMRQVYVSKFLFPLSAIIAQSLKFLAVLCILLAFLLVYGIEPSGSWLGMVPVLLAELVFISGLGLFLAALIPFFPDLKIVIDYIIQLGFFLSGIFYEVSQVPDSVLVFFQLNPMAMLIDQSRQVLLLQQGPDWGILAWIVIAGLALATLGSALLARYDREYPTMLLT